MSGVVAAGHPLSAEAGAAVIRKGGNAVDAAVAAVIASFAVESPLTGLGAGGYMMVHEPGGATRLIDFFVAAPGSDGTERSEDLVPVEVHFDAATTQVFNVGAASCGVPGTPAGLAFAVERYGSMPLSELVRGGVALAREGAALNAQQAYILNILAPIYTFSAPLRAVYAPEGWVLRRGERLRLPDLAEALERFGQEGPEPFYRGDIAERLTDAVLERGGTLSLSDLAGYEPVEREPVTARFRSHEVLTNPPPSSGGILIALALEVLERLDSDRGGDWGAGGERGGGDRHGADGPIPVEELVRAMAAANEARDHDFVPSLAEPGMSESFLAPERLDAVAARAARADRLGSTTHIVAVDGEGRCASVTCSNGTGSGLLVPGTGVHLNNMMGEQDLNPDGFHLAEAGTRMPSMMSPTMVLRDGDLIAGLGSAGSNRIRSAIVQTVVNLVANGMAPDRAVRSPRVHFEDGALQAEPGVDPRTLGRLERQGLPVVRWREPNLFFGGVQAVARRSSGRKGAADRIDPASGVIKAGSTPEWAGAADPRRGGAVATA